MSAGLSREDLDEVLRIFESAGNKLGLLEVKYEESLFGGA